MNATAIRAALRCGRSGCACARPNGNVHCPAHDDRDPSLSVVERDGKTLWHCHARCSQGAVQAALIARGLLPATRQHNGRTRHLVKTTRYEIRDPAGDLVAIHVRKDFSDETK